MPQEVSKVWLWTSQNAFLTSTDPATGKRWRDRYGAAYIKGRIHHGNIESYLSYKKLHRTGRLLKSIKKRVKTGNRAAITLYSDVQYARLQAEGGMSPTEFVPKGYIKGAYAVKVGGKIQSRPFMTPSKQVLRAPKRLVEQRMKKYGWYK